MVKVVFLQNVEDYKVGDVREVAEGYARNFLFRSGVAEVATEEKMKDIESKLSKIKKEEAENVKKAQDSADKLKKQKVVITEGVNEEGHLYGSVGAKEIAEAISEKGFDLDGADVELEQPIKELGDHEVIVKLGHGVETKITITIAREK
jgi:large subunit ribosomal protein L9